MQKFTLMTGALVNEALKLRSSSHPTRTRHIDYPSKSQNFLFFFTGAFAFSSNCLFRASRLALALSTGSSGSVGSALASCLCFSAGSAIWRSGVAEAVGAREDFVSRLAPPIVPSFLPCFGGDVSASSDSGAGGVGWGLAALRPPIVPSLDFGLGFSGDGVGDAWASIGVVDVGEADLVRARPPSVPRRLRGEGADG